MIVLYMYDCVYECMGCFYNVFMCCEIHVRLVIVIGYNCMLSPGL